MRLDIDLVLLMTFIGWKLVLRCNSRSKSKKIPNFENQSKKIAHGAG